MILEAVFLISVIIFLLVQFHEKPNDLPPGEWGLPIIGYLPAFVERPPDLLKRLRAKHGKTYCVKIGRRLYVVLSDFSTIKSNVAKAVFSDRPDFFTMKIFYYFKNAGIVFSNGLKWSSNRKFAIRVLTHFGMGKSKLEESINVEVSSLIKDFRTIVNKPVKIDWNLNVAVLNVIWGLAADKRFNQNDKAIHNFSELINENFTSLCGTAILLDFFPKLIPLMPRFVLNSMKVNVIERNRDLLMAYIDETIKEHLEKFDKNNIRDYIDMYLMEIYGEVEDKNSLSNEDFFELKASLLDLFAAGSETTSTSIRYYILYMAKHPEIQKKIHQEIDLNVPKDRFLSLDDKDNLTYFEASIYESLRIASLSPLGLPHATSEDTQIEGNRIPKGTVILPFVEDCHHNSDYWERPNDFYPEHFIDENGKFYIRSEGFLPFSLGRRKCLGEALARMELFLFTGAIMQNFTICEPEGHELSLNPNPKAAFLNSPLPFEVVLKEK